MAETRPDNTSSTEASADGRTEFEPWLHSRLEWFSDLKFGLFVHWGIYSVWGCCESWPLVPEDAWARDPQLPAWVDSGHDIERFQRAYRRLNGQFNPRAFDPDAWVAAAKAAGMRYFNFTTKHHDGFCMFDTATTEYRTTHPSCPFHDHLHANVTRALFERFRAAGFAISCYFSKSDWRCPYYWRPDRLAPTRNPNYDTHTDPECWRKFVEYTHAQIEELMTGYGPVDMLWLDGGQVRSPDQDIEMDRLVSMARRHQPGLIVVDRTVGGPHENVLTPEQQIPDAPLGRVWETNLTLGTSFSYKPDDEYKGVREVIGLLADIVSKGGNLLLNVGADMHGCLPAEAVERLRGVGAWLAANGEAIYGTRGTTPFLQSDDTFDVRYTRKSDTLYAIILPRSVPQHLPASIRLRGIPSVSGSPITMLGVDETVTWRQDGEDVLLRLPAALLEREPGRPAWVLKMKAPLDSV